MPKLSNASYGKQGIRVLSWIRADTEPAVRDLTIEVEVEGDFAESYLVGDNRRILPSDTFRRHVLAECEADPTLAVEELLLRIGRRILHANPTTTTVTVSAVEGTWHGIGRTSLVRDSSVRVTIARLGPTGESELESGIDGLELLNISGTGFSNFLRDDLTVQADAVDRPVSGRLDARWTYMSDAISPGLAEAVGKQLVVSLADRQSNSIQHLLTSAAQDVLASSAELERVRLRFASSPLSEMPSDLPTLRGTQTFEMGSVPVGVTTVEVRRDR